VTTARKGDWFVTFTGRRFYPLDAQVEDIDIRDIAHSLAMQTRWMGHCKNFYSIASHSLACARIAELEQGYEPRVEGAKASELMKWCLMHDAAEAYTGDIIRPIKGHLFVCDDLGVVLHDLDRDDVIIDAEVLPFKALEARLLMLIAERFGLPWPMPEAVKEIDNRMLVTEAYYLTNYEREEHWIYEKNWAHIKPYADNHVLMYQTMEEAEKAFLRLAKEYLPL
jgi:5'-deoxynucleotidase YfbR-like HD superfamily hydrolase